jgi:hypothetical protein
VNVRMADGSVVHRSYHQPHLLAAAVTSDRPVHAARRQRQAGSRTPSLATGSPGRATASDRLRTEAVAGDTLILRYYLLDTYSTWPGRTSAAAARAARS